MSKAILEFTLPEEREEFDMACKAGDYLSALQEFEQILRGIEKHGAGTCYASTLREQLWEILKERGVAW